MNEKNPRKSGHLAHPPTANSVAERGQAWSQDSRSATIAPAMEPADPAMRRPLYPLAPDSQTACSLPWFKIRLPIRAAFAHPWSADGWA
jgi:hypothetical protein